MLTWLTVGGLVLVAAILADDWLANRSRWPLSHMKPDPRSFKGFTGMKPVDQTRANKHIARLKD